MAGTAAAISFVLIAMSWATREGRSSLLIAASLLLGLGGSLVVIVTDIIDLAKCQWPSAGVAWWTMHLLGAPGWLVLRPVTHKQIS